MLKRAVFLLFIYSSLAYSDESLVKDYANRFSESRYGATNYNDMVLREWIARNNVLMLRACDQKSARAINNFPKHFEKFDVRVIKYNSIVGLDFSLERINFLIDPKCKIEKIYIG